jgi:hypothetical protein
MFVGLAAAVVTGGWLRLASVDHKASPSHDEAISFVAATCHQDGFSLRRIAIARSALVRWHGAMWNRGCRSA